MSDKSQQSYLRSGKIGNASKYTNNQRKDNSNQQNIVSFHFLPPNTSSQSQSLNRYSLNKREPKHHGAHGGHSRSNKGGQRRKYSMSKAEYLRANFTYIIRELTSNDIKHIVPGLNPSTASFKSAVSEPYLHDSDESIPWNVILELIRASGRKMNESDLSNLAFSAAADKGEGKCPICLCKESKITAARIAECGHIFCFPCVLRYLLARGDKSGSYLKARDKCPVCAENVIDLWDVKPVSFADNLSQCADSLEHLAVGATFTAQNVFFRKGWVVPCVNETTADDSCESVVMLAPSCDSSSGRFSRICRGNVLRELQTVQRELQELQYFKERCLRTGHDLPISTGYYEDDEDGDVEYIPSINQCVELLREKEVHLNEQLDMELRSSGGVRKSDNKQLQLIDKRNPKSAEQVSTQRVEDSWTDESDFDLASPVQIGTKLSDSVNINRDSPPNFSRKVRSMSESSNGASSTTAVVHTYQSLDGSAVYLHPLCVQIIVEESRLGSSLPPNVTGKVLELERVIVAVDTRQRFPLLRHLPMYSEVWFVEIDMTSLVSQEVLLQFQDKLSHRAAKRLQQEQQRERELEQRIEEERLEEMLVQSRREHYKQLQQVDETILQDLRSGPALPSTTSECAEGSKIAREFRADSVGSADGKGPSLPLPPPPPTPAVRTSFAQVTSMGGNYPVLLPSTPVPAQRSISEPPPSESGSASSRWRAMAAGAPSPSPASDFNSPSSEPSQSPPPHSSSGKGIGKKGKSSRKNEVSLFSNSISRSYR